MADTHTRTRSGITVVGVGSASAPVDHVTITLVVEVRRADPGDAFRVTAHSATAVLAMLADHGVDSRSVRTSSLSLGPEWAYTDGRNEQVGYQARQELQVSVQGLAGVDRMLTDVATRAGEGVFIGGINLLPGAPDAALAQARAAAFTDAAARAEQLAAMAHRPLGRVEWVDEDGGRGGPEPLVHYRRSAAGADVAASMPIAGGDATVTVSLVVHYSFAA